MQQNINLEFYLAAGLDDRHHSYYFAKRQPAGRYATVLISDCQHKDWWYNKFIGLEVFVELCFKNYGYGEFLGEVTCIRLHNSKKTVGRSIDAKDIIIK